MPNDHEDAEGPEAGDEDKPTEEGVVPRVTPSPGMPTARERAIHRITHIPYRSWCDDCVRGRGRDRHHKLCGAYGSSTTARVHMDYCFLTETASAASAVSAEADAGETSEAAKDESKKRVTTLVMKETGCGSVWAYPVRHKGTVNEPGVSKQIVWDLDTCGLKEERIVVKSDQEPAITALGSEIGRVRGSKGTAMDESRVSDSNSNGTIEQAVQEVEGMSRTIRSALETRLGQPITLDHLVTPWIIRHAAANITRH